MSGRPKLVPLPPAGGDDADGTARFAPVTPLRAYEYVAEQIQRHIKLHLAAPGQSLPTERELVEQFEVGRPTIQMALRLLEAEGLVETRRGRNGGTFVLGPGDGDDARLELIGRMLRRRDEIEDLLVFRRAVEPQIASVAARRRTDADLARLRTAVEELDRAEGEVVRMRFDTELHLALGAATGNRFLARDAEEIRRGLNDVIALLPESGAWHRRVAVEHHALLDAVVAGDGPAAAGVMETHTEHSRQAVRAVLTAIDRREDI